MRTARFFVCHLLIVAGCGLGFGCFGDNNSSDSPPDAVLGDDPSVVEITSPDGVDPGEAIDVTIKVKGKANEQLSVATEATLGTFSPQNKIVIANQDGEGTFVTRYTAGQTTGVDNVTVNVANLAGASRSATRGLTVFESERVGNVTAVGAASVQAADLLIAYPVVLSTARVVSKLGVLAPPQSPAALVDAQLGLYATDTATSVKVLARATAKLAPGLNDIAIAPQALAAGTYWIVIAYAGTPLVYRSTTQLIALRYKTTHVYADGLGDTIVGLITSAADLTDPAARYYIRNLYLVLRK